MIFSSKVSRIGPWVELGLTIAEVSRFAIADLENQWQSLEMLVLVHNVDDQRNTTRSSKGQFRSCLEEVASLLLHFDGLRRGVLNIGCEEDCLCALRQ